MTALPGLATTLKAAYRVCDVKPLEGEALERYYVPLESRQDAIVNLQSSLRIREVNDFTPLLFTGHVGCGKSSELARIAQHWQNDYEIVLIKDEGEIDVNDVEYTDIYLLVIKQVEYALRQAGVRFDPDLQRNFENWFKDVAEESEESIERSVNVEAEASLGGEAPFLAKLLFKVLAQIKGASKTKKTVREVLQRDVSRLKTDINLLLTDGLKRLKAKYPHKRGFFVILDGLDKCPRNVAERLFFDYAPQLQELHCTMLYTVPIGSLYTPRGIGRSFENPHIVPMVCIYEYDPDRLELDHKPDGLEAMASLVERRVEVDAIFESREQLLELCRISGGHLRFLMQLMRTACLTAEGRAHARIQDDDITYAIKQLQFRFEREIPRRYYPTLVQIAKTKQLPEDEISPELLFSTAVLEYNGENQWKYPNPVVRRSELFKRALLDANGES